MGPTPELRLRAKESAAFCNWLTNALKSASITQREAAKALGKFDCRWIERTLAMKSVPCSRVRAIVLWLYDDMRFSSEDHHRAAVHLAAVMLTEAGAQLARDRSPGNPVPIPIPRFAAPQLVDELRAFLVSECGEAPSKAVLTRFFERPLYPNGPQTYREECVSQFMSMARAAGYAAVRGETGFLEIEGLCTLTEDHFRHYRFPEEKRLNGVDLRSLQRDPLRKNRGRNVPRKRLVS